LELPHSSGVYWFQNSAKNILYIGKAKNLKARINTYRTITKGQPKADPPRAEKTKIFLSQAKYIQFTEVESELQALILEAKLIKSIKPKYNIRLKDDKSPLYIVISQENFPRVLTVRKQDLLTTSYPIANIFGPFQTGYKTKQILKTLRRIFPYCNSRTKKAPCFYTHINLCSGTCKGKISTRQYKYMINRLKLVLQGQNSKVIKSLEAKMKRLSKLKKYEQAAKIRDQILNLNALSQKHWSNIDPQLELTMLAKLLKLDKKPQRIETYDISNIQGKYATGSMIVFTNGQPDKDQYRRFKIKAKSGKSGSDRPDDAGMLHQVLQRRICNPWPKADLIIIDGGKPQVQAIKKLIKTIPVLGIAKSPDRFIYNTKTIKPDSSSPALKLVQRCRDEAHRFAKSYHTYLRQKGMLS